MKKTLSESTPEEIGLSPFNLYVYAVTVLKGPLPPAQHGFMERMRSESSDEHVRGYFEYLARKNTIWGRIRSFLGL